MQDDKDNRFIKCSICGAIGNWHDLINAGFCHNKVMNNNGQSNGSVSVENEDNDEFTQEELEEIMEEYGEQRL